MKPALVALVAVWLAAAASAVAQPAAPALAAGDVAHQVLVLLRLPPEHHHPNGDYGGGYGEGAGDSARRRIAERIAKAHGLVLVTAWPMPLLGLDCYVMATPPDQSPVEVAAALSHEPDVDWAEPMRTYHGQGATTTPNDPLFRVQPAARQWRLGALHEISTGRDVRVAVIDSMIERTHPDLVGQVYLSENFVTGEPDGPEQHGTGVAGIIAAREGNGVGIVGVAPRARLMGLRACWQVSARSPGGSATLCDSLSLAKALHFAILHDAQIINLSLSGPDDPLLGRLLDVALARGVTVVAAYDPSAPDGGFPASHAGVVAVNDEARGVKEPGVFEAPGSDVPTSQIGGRWFLVSGSSYAAAHVSGLFALLRQRTARPLGGASLVTLGGSTIIDACASLVRASGPCGCQCVHAQYVSAIEHQ
jgi:hypothetical protein